MLREGRGVDGVLSHLLVVLGCLKAASSLYSCYISRCFIMLSGIIANVICIAWPKINLKLVYNLGLRNVIRGDEGTAATRTKGEVHKAMLLCCNIHIVLLPVIDLTSRLWQPLSLSL